MNYQDAIKGYTGVIQAYAIADRTLDKLSNDAWAVLAREISGALKSGKDGAKVKTEMKAAEETWKAATGETSMPSTYRSAKAVALKGVEAGVELLDADGNPKGKTAIEKEYKAKAEAEAIAAAGPGGMVEDAVVSHAYQIIRKIQKYWGTLSAAEQEEIINFVNYLPRASHVTTVPKVTSEEEATA